LVEDKDPPEIGDTILEVKMPNKKRLSPISIMVVDTIAAVKSRTLLKVLFDPGSTATLINHTSAYLNSAKRFPSNRNAKSTHWWGPVRPSP